MVCRRAGGRGYQQHGFARRGIAQFDAVGETELGIDAVADRAMARERRVVQAEQGTEGLGCEPGDAEGHGRCSIGGARFVAAARRGFSSVPDMTVRPGPGRRRPTGRPARGQGLG